MSAAKPDLLRYCFDTEFVDGPKPFAIEFFSIGIVPENFRGRNYYGVSNSFNEAASIRHILWLKDNVIAKLPPLSERKTPALIKKEIITYLKPAKKVEFWAKNGAYDQYALAKIFGTMNAMRHAFEIIGIDQVVFRDIDELTRAAGYPQLPKEPEAKAHISVEDAKWDRHLFRLLSADIKNNQPAVYKALGL